MTEHSEKGHSEKERSEKRRSEDVQILELDEHGKPAQFSAEPEVLRRSKRNPWLIVMWIVVVAVLAIGGLGLYASSLPKDSSFSATPYGNNPETQWLMFLNQFGYAFLTTGPIILFGAIAVHALVWERRHSSAPFESK